METNNDTNEHKQSEILLKFANALAISCCKSELRRQSQLLGSNSFFDYHCCNYYSRAMVKRHSSRKFKTYNSYSNFLFHCICLAYFIFNFCLSRTT